MAQGYYYFAMFIMTHCQQNKAQPLFIRCDPWYWPMALRTVNLV